MHNRYDITHYLVNIHESMCLITAIFLDKTRPGVHEVLNSVGRVIQMIHDSADLERYAG